jgi:hypothetical protein
MRSRYWWFGLLALAVVIFAAVITFEIWLGNRPLPPGAPAPLGASTRLVVTLSAGGTAL